MAKELTDLTNVEPADSDYPYGDLRDNTGTNNGTPVNRDLLTDPLQFFQKLMDEGGVTPNNQSDNEYNGWQLFEAFLQNIPKKFVKVTTTKLDDDPITVTRSEIEAAFAESNPFYDGSVVGGSANSNLDLQIQVWLDNGDWELLVSGADNSADGNSFDASINETTGDITIITHGAPVSDFPLRIVLIG